MCSAVAVRAEPNHRPRVIRSVVSHTLCVVGLKERPSVRVAERAVARPERIYVAIQYGTVASGVEFDWDDENKRHLDAHNVAPAEFEQLLNNDPLDLSFDVIDNEERYRSVGLTDAGRWLSVAWTIRHGKVRAITAFPASVSDRKAFLERPK